MRDSHIFISTCNEYQIDDYMNYMNDMHSNQVVSCLSSGLAKSKNVPYMFVLISWLGWLFEENLMGFGHMVWFLGFG